MRLAGFRQWRVLLKFRAITAYICSGYPGFQARLIAIGLFVALNGSAAFAQGAAAGNSHAEHHAGQSGNAEEGGCCGVPTAKPFYPSLMDVPSLTPELRRQIEEQGHARINAGNQKLVQAQDEYHRAMIGHDAGAMERASVSMRQGLAEMASGSAALQALAEGKPPRDIALSWFRNQLNVPGTPTAAEPHRGPFGLSWFHLITMAAIVAFAIAMAAVFIARARRARALVQRLISGNQSPPSSPPVPPVAAAPAAAGSPAPAPAVAPTATQAPPAAAPAAPRPKAWSGALRVAAVFRETPNVRTFRLMEPQGGPIPFTFFPGQFLTISAEIDGARVQRSYTIASPPTRRDYVEITVKHEENGVVSGYLHNKVHQGDTVQIGAPYGVFSFTGEEADSIVLIGGGVGITPLMSVLRYLTDRAWPGDIFLLNSVRSTEDFIFRDELEYLQCRHDNLRIAATMARASGTAWMGPQGFITRELIVQTVPEIARRRVHLCGPPPMMEATKALLSELGVPKEQVKTEAFGPAKGQPPPPGATFKVKEAPGVTPAAVPGPEVAAASGAAPAPAASAAIGPATAWIRFQRSGKAAPLPPDESVLEVAESIDVPIDYSCRVGVCGTCKVPLLEGTVTMEVEEGLPPEEKARGMILACQAKSVGNLVVDA